MLKQYPISELELGIDEIKDSPKDNGVLEMIVRRPETETREIINAGEINLENGLAGDNWKARGNDHTPDGSADPEAQITLMNSRVIQLLSGDKENWQWAGDQLFVDMDLGIENLPPHSRIQVGSVILEISAKPHTGCKKFSGRFGIEALEFISTPLGKALRMRGVNAKVIQAGEIKVGDVVKKL
ncbi:MAG: MOSC domain-containing protein [Anaerolineales bacterium]|nr:MOSC domain-containing protein [Anaerolineales bacterium]